MTNYPRVGVGVIILKDDKVLLGKRKNAHGQGSWSFPGGHLELQETIEKCAKREVQEETGMSITNLKKSQFTNDVFVAEEKHYVTLFIVADWLSGEPHVLEPQKCECWKWFSWDELPKPLFLPIENLLREGFSPFM